MQIELFDPPPAQEFQSFGGMPRSVQMRYDLARRQDTLTKVLSLIPADTLVTWGHIRSSLDITLGLALTESLRLLEARGDIETQNRYFGSPSPIFDNYLGFEVLYRKRQ